MGRRKGSKNKPKVPESFISKLAKFPLQVWERGTKRFDWLYRTLKGRTDIKSKLMLILNPDKPQTTTFLNSRQGHFQTSARFTANSWDEFKPLEDYANQQALSALGVKGQGIDASVRLTGALGESKLLQKLGITSVREKANE